MSAVSRPASKVLERISAHIAATPAENLKSFEALAVHYKDEPEIAATFRKAAGVAREIESFNPLKDKMKTTPIDWAFYRKHISTPNFVDRVEKLHKEIKNEREPTIDVDAPLAEFEAEMEKLYPVVEQFDEACKRRLVELDAEKEDLQKKAESIADWTLTELMANFPEELKRFEQELIENKWDDEPATEEADHGHH
eukprot:TRINITY_DN1056_c0_g1_i1.p1 TRINITY_DN1056_c0_g1~~TRINITY_DN1056_c0_g1_i1.p1  ORF type:complete len:196 (-),score=58.64 TRINITY_DN1056_c0_g1_i1:605-1192(-)